MSKRDELLKAGGANILSSMGVGQGGQLPAGLDPSTATKRPDYLEGTSKEKGAYRIAVDRIIPDPEQPRTEFDEDELNRLAESLKTRGQLQPIRVRWDQGRKVYVVIMGERRWRAARMAGLADLSCIVHEGELEAGDRLGLQLIENALRSDLKPIEQARAYERLMKARDWSARHLAGELAIAPATVTRALALLDLPESVQAAVDSGELAAHTAYEVSKLDDAEVQAEVAEAVVRDKLKRGEVTELVSAIKAKRPAPAAKPEPVTFDLGDGTTVKIAWRKANATDVVKALRLALKRAQAEVQKDEAA